MKGTPFLFNGEEIGMADLELTSIEQFRDTAAVKQYQMLTTQFGQAPAAALQAVIASTRDRCRSPLQWSSAPNGGFSPAGVATWLPVHANHGAGVNVADQEQDPASLLNFYRRLLQLRRTTPALVAGEYQPLLTDHEAIFACWRHDAASRQRCLVLLNFSAQAQPVTLEVATSPGRLLLTSSGRAAGPLDLGALTLAPFEIIIAEE